MENFNIKRFGSYLKADIASVRSRFGVSMLVMAAMPLLCYVISGLYNLIFDGSWTSLNYNPRVVIFVVTLISFMLTLPSKSYGFVTEKHAGTSFILLPVSILEKELSMLVICCFIAPACFIAGYGFLDFAICSIDHSCGAPILKFSEFKADIRANLPFFQNVGSAFLLIDDLIQTILIFLLGAVWFKKSKVAKTILVSFAVVSILGLISTPIVRSIFGTYGVNQDNFHLFADKFQWTFSHLGFLDTMSDTVVNAALCVAIYFRLKTIKH